MCFAFVFRLEMLLGIVISPKFMFWRAGEHQGFLLYVMETEAAGLGSGVRFESVIDGCYNIH